MAVVLRSKGYTFQVKDSELGLADGGDPHTTYTLRQLTRPDYKKAIADNTKHVANPRTRGMESVTDWVGVSDDLLDLVLVAWDGVVDSSGQPAPCIREAKVDGLTGDLVDAILAKAGLREIRAGEADRPESFR